MRRVGHARHTKAGVPHTPHAIRMAEPARRLAERKCGRPWSHYDPTLKAQAMTFVRSGMAGRDVAEILGVPSAAVVCLIAFALWI